MTVAGANSQWGQRVEATSSLEMVADVQFSDYAASYAAS
jgi:hypothetical protein